MKINRFALKNKAEDIIAATRARCYAAYWPSLTIDRDVRIGKRVTISCEPGSTIDLRGTRIKEGVAIEAAAGATITIGRSIIGRFAVISARESISIGDGTGVADMSTVRDHNHLWNDTEGSDRTRWTTGPITIGDAAWLGSKVTVTSGVSIGNGVVVGAGAVVTRSIPPLTKVGGIPARPISSSRIAVPSSDSRD